eukprot:CAMPEP_0113672328 /NCGR_PEP_ID=MMETSP0038_2-20120614/6199_1 /TAXON_ID=2898 /ORGANISM="Cryptomonas paramecium" /LENGTH=60 /DNA_ID=CAMNT_0000588579 /DNA_START=295 /DNA_END=474 /DNA_ORIENTATION=+ /assembly_acc=CAM_ASM_000170
MSGFSAAVAFVGSLTFLAASALARMTAGPRATSSLLASTEVVLPITILACARFHSSAKPT